MTSSTSPGFHAGDLLRINTDGTVLREYAGSPTSTWFALKSTLGLLNEDDTVIVMEVHGDYVNVISRLGKGWVYEDCISDLFEH